MFMNIPKKVFNWSSFLEVPGTLKMTANASIKCSVDNSEKSSLGTKY